MRLALLLAAALLVAGCGTSDDRDQARATVESFYAAIDADDPGAACDALSEALRKELESCETEVTKLSFDGGEIERTQVFMTNAKVDLSSGESAFLSREDEGWRLSAIGCKPEEGKPADRPLECEAEV